jgi:hypothetical protein
MKKKTTQEIRELMFKAADSCKPIKHHQSIKLTNDEIIVIETALLTYVATTTYGDYEKANKLHDRFYKLRQDLCII